MSSVIWNTNQFRHTFEIQIDKQSFSIRFIVVVEATQVSHSNSIGFVCQIIITFDMFNCGQCILLVVLISIAAKLFSIDAMHSMCSNIAAHNIAEWDCGHISTHTRTHLHKHACPI